MEFRYTWLFIPAEGIDFSLHFGWGAVLTPPVSVVVLTTRLDTQTIQS